MHISKVSLVNYRNFERANVAFSPGVNTIIGENGSGKSNLFRAIRLLLDESLVTRRHDFNERDFHRGVGDWRGHWIVIMIEFANVSSDEVMQSLLLHQAAEESSGTSDRATYAMVFRPKAEVRDKLAGLSLGDHTGLAAVQATITIDDYERVLTGKMKADLTDPEVYARIVGDFAAVRFPSDANGAAPTFLDEIGIRVQREMSLWREFSLSFVPALRNVVADFNDSRKNPLRTLLAAKSEEIPEGDFDGILEKVRELNSDIEGREDVQRVTRGIQKTFKDTVGETYSPTSMRIQSELPLEASDLFKSLKLYVGENGDADPRGLHEMSLGGANLVYLTLKLLEFEYRTARQAIANFLLIEEPEAHIHTHVQKTLFDRVAYADTQIIYSTHSTQISEVSEIERINVLSREGEAWVALQPSTGLDDPEIQSAQRYLDAVRSNLLFARSVLLVEGDAEEILIPSLMKEIYGISLDEIGVSLVNVRSTGFENVANLFHPIRLRKRCAILTDSDQPYFDTTHRDGDDESVRKRKVKAIASAKSGTERKAKLDDYVAGNDYVHVEYAPHTFEVDFADTSALNRTILTSVVDKVYERNAERVQVKADFAKDEIAAYGRAALRLATKAGKGWFALLLAGQLRTTRPDGDPMLPGYVVQALGFAAAELPTDTWVRILEHRIHRWGESPEASADVIALGRGVLVRLHAGEITFESALAELRSASYVDVRLQDLAQAFGK